jgi:hypothetical protein
MLGRADLRTQSPSGRPSLDDIDTEILLLVRKYPFFSVRTIPESLEITASIIYRHSVKKICLKIVLLRWVPHALAAELRQKRVEFSSQLLRALESQQRVGFRDIVTSEESWCLQHYDHRQIWCTSADEAPTKVTHKIAQKTMLIDSVILINWLIPGKISKTVTSAKNTRAAFRDPA